ncbi:HAMP domain-containing histidine kinase [Oscillospiraceae bacterium OttesenSCG-928-F05]|nr:HAMP domain-containing histidine kinase [Oscillospiraceae bacterium OttesenSCG-928-F05]
MDTSRFTHLLEGYNATPMYVLAASGDTVFFANTAAATAAGRDLCGQSLAALLSESGALLPLSEGAHVTMLDCAFFGVPCTLDLYPGDPVLAIFRPVETGRVEFPFAAESVAAISREFRAPLTALFAAANLLRGRMETDEKNAGYLAVMVQNCYKLLRLTNNLIDLARFSSDDTAFAPSNGDLVAFCDEICQKIRPLAEVKGLPIRFESSLNSLQIAFDPQKLERMLLNLLSNAVKHSEGSSLITLRLSATPERALLQVSDNGKGMDTAVFPFAFSAYRLDDRPLGRGYGIGLSIVNAIAAMHGGSAMLESREGRGTTVTVSLPNASVSSESQLRQAVAYDYAGGFDHFLLELCDVFDSEEFVRLLGGNQS